MLLGQELKFKNKLCNLKLGTFFSALPGLGASALSGRVASSKYMINEEGMHVIRDKDARDSGQLLHFGDFFCIFALSFIKNGKWEINH